MITLDGITKIYESENVNVKALDNINLTFPGRGMVFVLGKSGSGKSTLLNLMAGLDETTSGTISVSGKDLGKDLSFDDYRNNILGFIFQEFNLNKALTVAENVLTSERLLNRPANKDLAETVLESVGLGGKGKKKIRELSGGEQQRTAIARAVIKNPKIILADEPTGNLDENNGRIIFEILKKFSRDRLVVVVSHDRPAAEKYADRIIELSDGKILSDTERNENYVSEAVVSGDKIILPYGAELKAADLALINENPEKKVELSGEKRFAPSKNQNDESVPADEVFKPAGKLKAKNIAWMAWRNLASRAFRTLVTILLTGITFAVMGLSVVTQSYNQHKADSITFGDNSNGEIVVFAGGWNNYGRFEINSGAPLSEDVKNNFKENYEGYAPIYKLSGFSFGEDEESGLGGVYEIEEQDLQKFGYTLMNVGEKRFPATGELVEKDGFALPEVVITDYLLYTMYKQLEPEVFPTEKEALRRYLNGGFEAQAVEDINNLAIGKYKPSNLPFPIPASNNFDNGRMRVVGVLDTGYKDAFFDYVFKTPEDEDWDKEYANYVYNIENYYLMLYAASGFTKNCYYESAYSYDTGTDIQKDVNLGEKELVLSANFYKRLFGEDFSAPKTLDENFHMGNVNWGGYTIINVVAHDGKNFKTDFGIKTSEAGFKYAAESLTFQIGARFEVEDGQIAGLFDFMDEHSLYYASVYSYATYNASGTIGSMQTIFIPITAIIAVVSVVAIGLFLVTAVTKKQKDIGVLKALGAKNSDIIKVYIVEALITLLSVMIISSLLTFGFVTMADNLISESIKAYFDFPALVDGITLFYLTYLPFVINIAAIAVIGIASVIYPTVKISKMQPIDAIKKT